MSDEPKVYSANTDHFLFVYCPRFWRHPIRWVRHRLSGDHYDHTWSKS